MLAAQALNELRFVDDDDHPLAGARHDLFAQQRAAESFDEIERMTLDLVGAVDRDIDAAMLGEARERHAELAPPRGRPFARGNSHDPKAARATGRNHFTPQRNGSTPPQAP